MIREENHESIVKEVKPVRARTVKHEKNREKPNKKELQGKYNSILYKKKLRVGNFSSNIFLSCSCMKRRC